MRSLSRRDFLGQALGVGAGVFLSPALAWSGQRQHVILSAGDDKQGKHYLLAVDMHGHTRFRHQTDFRGHGMAVSGQGEQVLMFARRPGTEACVLNLKTGALSQTLRTPANRHFYGHGCFSADGGLLFTSENVFDGDFAAHEGVIGVWDAKDYSRLGEIASGAIGPHELRLMPDGKTLVVANGGIHTHPELARRKLNIADMKPALAYVDIARGEVVERVELDDPHLSIRHLWVAEDGLVATVLQDQKANQARALSQPLLVLHRRGGKAQTLLASERVQKRLSGYVASVCIAPKSGVVAVSSPRGDVLVFWDSRSGNFMTSIDMKGVSGLALSPDKRHFIASSDRGEMRFIDAQSLQVVVSLGRVEPNRLWDNHLLVV